MIKFSIRHKDNILGTFNKREISTIIAIGWILTYSPIHKIRLMYTEVARPKNYEFGRNTIIHGIVKGSDNDILILGEEYVNSGFNSRLIKIECKDHLSLYSFSSDLEKYKLTMFRPVDVRDCLED